MLHWDISTAAVLGADCVFQRHWQQLPYHPVKWLQEFLDGERRVVSWDGRDIIKLSCTLVLRFIRLPSHKTLLCLTVTVRCMQLSQQKFYFFSFFRRLE